MFGTTLAARVPHCWQLPAGDVQEFKVVCTDKERFHKKGHTHNRNIMFHSDWQYRRFACTAAVIVLPPPPPL